MESTIIEISGLTLTGGFMTYPVKQKPDLGNISKEKMFRMAEAARNLRVRGSDTSVASVAPKKKMMARM